jgi:hypothetical protein
VSSSDAPPSSVDSSRSLPVSAHLIAHAGEARPCLCAYARLKPLRSLPASAHLIAHAGEARRCLCAHARRKPLRSPPASAHLIAHAAPSRLWALPLGPPLGPPTQSRAAPGVGGDLLHSHESMGSKQGRSSHATGRPGGPSPGPSSADPSHTLLSAAVMDASAAQHAPKPGSAPQAATLPEVRNHGESQSRHERLQGSEATSAQS